jgi:hypothetical protein
MAGLFAYAAAGLAEGVGDTFVQRAKDKKEAAREKLRMDFQTSERIGGQEFRTTEREAGQEFTGEQNQANRDATTENNRLDRESREALANAQISATERRNLETDSQFKTYHTNTDGDLVGIRADGTASVITDNTGKVVKPATNTRESNPYTDTKTQDETARDRATDIAGPRSKAG